MHPDDVSEFEKYPNHGFNLDFPPPAFIGDIVNAPVIILDNNGGYNSELTPGEFPDPKAYDEHREMLANPRPVSPIERTISPYYRKRNYSQWLEDGVAALVNGVAYRSVNGQENEVAQLTKSLPSASFHQKWLRHSILPLVERGERFVVVHRWSRWNGATDAFLGLPNSVISKAPVNKNLTSREVEAVKVFLIDR